jgi:Family of unknown function (DUF6390)
VNDAPGPVLFARYAYPPNALGYCGPNESAALLEMAALKGPVDELTRQASQFEGAWPYMQLIAGCNGIADPLDRRVVHAYWIGNPLVRRVPPEALARSLARRFDGRAGRQLEPLVSGAWWGVPQHSLHVFAVYPWLGLLRAGMDGPPLTVLDRCRIRAGRVQSVDGDMVTVWERPLILDGSVLVAGPVQLSTARRSVAGLGFVGDLAPGDLVSLHWDWVCDRLSVTEAGWLDACTRRNLDAVNRPARPGPAVVCDS